MSDLYSNIHALCEKEGIKDGTLCSNIGIRRSFLSELKAGRTKSLSAEILSKIAAYFNVSVDYLLTGNQKENPPQQLSQDGQDIVDYLVKRFDGMSEEDKKLEMNKIQSYIYSEIQKMI